MGGAIQAEVKRAKSDGSELAVNSRLSQPHGFSYADARIAALLRERFRHSLAIFLSEQVACGIAGQSWTIPGQEKRRSAPLDGFRRLGLERIQL